MTSIIEYPLLIDLSDSARTGLRGVAAEKYLQSLGVDTPVKPNQATFNNDFAVLRLSPKEFWLLEHPLTAEQTVDNVLRETLPEQDAYRLFCRDSHAWFWLIGDQSAAVMAKVCGVDLRTSAFPPGAIAQTSVARVNAIVVHQTLGNETCFNLLCDSAAAEYFRSCLLDAMAEFGGQCMEREQLLTIINQG